MAGVFSVFSGPPLVVADDVLYGVRNAVAKAWAADRGTALALRPQPTVTVHLPGGGTARNTAPPNIYDHGGDVLGVDDWTGTDAHMPPLGRYLKAANFNLGRVIPSSVRVFDSASGEPTALPISISQIQFYVNDTALLGLGLKPSAAWTLDRMVEALDASRRVQQRPRSEPLIAGMTWTDVRLWGAWVLGLGGRLVGGGEPDTSRLNPGRQLDLRATVNATAKLVAFARKYGWSPPSQTGATYPDSFPFDGFAGPYRRSLFAFMPPWTAGGPSGPFTRMIPSAFPTLPSERVAPAWLTHGLAISAYSKHPQATVDFMLWLYQPKQQRLLADQGIPPVVTSPEARSDWRRLQSHHRAAAAPLVDLDHYTDVLAQLPPWGPGFPALLNYNAVLQPALLSAYEGRNSVSVALSGVASTFDLPTAGITAGSVP